VNNVLTPQPNFGGLLSIGFGNSEATSYDIPVGLVAKIAKEWVSFFQWLFGGSGAPPTPRKLLHARHVLYPNILAISDGWIPDESSAGAPEICGDKHVCNTPVLQKQTPEQKTQACEQGRVELETCLAVFEAPSDIPESVAIYACVFGSEEFGPLACAGAAAIELPKKIGEAKCFYDYYQSCK
jgi:hypothetical protein